VDATLRPAPLRAVGVIYVAGRSSVDTSLGSHSRPAVLPIGTGHLSRRSLRSVTAPTNHFVLGRLKPRSEHCGQARSCRDISFRLRGRIGLCPSRTKLVGRVWGAPHPEKFKASHKCSEVFAQPVVTIHYCSKMTALRCSGHQLRPQAVARVQIPLGPLTRKSRSDVGPVPTVSRV
jgi:hypothetical protein